MKDLKAINKKTKTAIILIVVTVLLLISNHFISLNSKKTNESIKAIYNDRLLVSHYIFQYTNTIHQLKSLTEKTTINDIEKHLAVNTLLQKMGALDIQYLSTVLTTEEKKQFAFFQLQCDSLKIENQNKDWQQVQLIAEQIAKTLVVLAQIQIDEGKTALTIANTIHNGNKLFVRFEIGLFFILACLSFYLLLLKKMKVKIKIPEGPSLN
ncbi:hypothetical protein [Flavobacterium sp. UMI-01]|uniref:hypothetical protein n=1 Tax=Flavobacterium sp. UMI-01 TaxID=1441053 RepID=UPI001C7DBE38|nr:hypothetical protein [Flavobacterium sp. UMI-01]GIZ07801.1 hypothetical protein FUMI01_05280 [Flavobacterium sp. UMI-01]